MATKMSDGCRLVPRNINAKHGPIVVVTGTSETAVNSKRHLILLLSMQCISQCLNCCLIQYIMQ